MKSVLIIIFLLIVLVVAFFLTQNAIKGSSFSFLGSGGGAKAAIDGKTFNLSVADTEKEREVGLSEKKSLGKNEGMLFKFDKETTPTFWMKDMNFPIDILFIRDGKIVTIYKNVKPPSSNQALELYRPKEPVDKVIEIQGGLSDEYGFKEGDSIEVTL